jgi:hypothetical protein
MATLAPVDPTVKVPAAVARAAAAANARQEQYTKEVTQQGSEDSPPQPDQPPVQQQAPAQPDQPPVQPEQPPVQQQADATLEDQNRALDQNLKTTLGRLQTANDTIRSLNERLTNMERTMAFMASQPAAEDDPQQNFEAKKYVTDEDVQTFGSDFFDAVERKVKEIVEGSNAEIYSKVKNIEQRVGGVQQVIKKDDRGRMIERLDRDVSDWKGLNEDPEFVAWLNETDPLTGGHRHAMLLAAWEVNDAPRVAAFFTTFLREQAAVSANEPRVTNGQPPAPVTNLGAFAAPGRAKANGVTQQGSDPAKPNITRKYISSFYTDVAAGKYRSNPARQAQIERDIHAAGAEGRIR